MLVYENLNYYQKITFLFVNIQALIGLVGIGFNVLTIVIFARKRFKYTSYSTYYRAMAIFDSILLSHTFRHWARFILGFDLDIVGSIFCKLGEYQPHVAGHTSLWLLCVVLVDRLVTIIYRNRIRLLKQKWFQLTQVFVILLYSSLLHLILPLNFQLTKIKPVDDNNSSNSVDVWVCRAPGPVLQINSWLVFVNTFIIMITNSILYIVLISHIYKSRKRITRRNKKVIKRDLKFAVCSIVLTFTNFLSKVPIGIGLFIVYWNELIGDQLQMVYSICVAVAIISHGATFFVCTILNSTFSHELKEMFCPCLKMKSQR